MTDKTEILLKDALENAGLTPSEAGKVSHRAQENSDAIERFEKIEKALNEIVDNYAKLKKLSWVLFLLVFGNYGGDNSGKIAELLKLIGLN
jgi:hypothetical protein